MPYTSTIRGLPGTTSGATALRYVVTDGGLLGSDADSTGIDALTLAAVPEPTSCLLRVPGVGGLLPRSSRAARA